MNDQRYIIYDSEELYEIMRITEVELIHLLLLKEEGDLLEQFLFRDKQCE
jgi:hypothetical protein